MAKGSINKDFFATKWHYTGHNKNNAISFNLQ